MTKRERLSATVDAQVLAHAHDAVASGRAESVSAWVNEALKRQADNDSRMDALADLIATYEAENGEITDDEIVEATRRSRSRSTVVRSQGKRPSRRKAGAA